MDTIFFNSIAVDCPSATLITLQTGKAHLATQCMYTVPCVIVSDCLLCLITAKIRITAWACEKVDRDQTQWYGKIAGLSAGRHGYGVQISIPGRGE